MPDWVQQLKLLFRIYEDAFPDEYCTKFSGALAVELLRTHIRSSGIPVSPRDVFMKGIPNEFDLLIPTHTARPRFGLLYDPADIHAVIEVKYRGAVGLDSETKIRTVFRRVVRHAPHIRCIYVALMETKTYKYAVTSKTLRFPAFTLVWYQNGGYTDTGQWPRLLKALQ